MEAKLNPIFARHLSLGDSATSLFNSNIFGEIQIIIGSNHGRCYQLPMNRFDKFELIYEDPKHRQIIAIGFWPFSAEEFINQSNKLNPIIWLHFRSSSISLFEIVRNDCQQTRLILLRELTTDHYGFCQTFADYINGRMFIPDHEDTISTFRFRYQNGGETIIRLEEEFLNKKLAMKDENAMFKGMLMGIEPVEKTDNCVFLAFEDSTICIFNWRTKQLLDALKHPKHCEFLCWSLLPKTNTNQTLIAISVIGQLYLLSYFDKNETKNEMLRAECIIKKSKDNNFNCTSIAFPKNNQNNYFQLGVGLKNGTILIYSLQSNSNSANDHSPPRWSHQLLAQCENAHSNSIQCLRWIPHHPKEASTNSFGPTILCSGGADEKISFYEFTSF